MTYKDTPEAREYQRLNKIANDAYDLACKTNMEKDWEEATDTEMVVAFYALDHEDEIWL